MKNKQCMKELGATVTCTIRVEMKTAQDKDAVTILMGNAWFSSVCTVVATANKSMEVIC